jgi:hypothetical protein
MNVLAVNRLVGVLIVSRLENGIAVGEDLIENSGQLRGMRGYSGSSSSGASHEGQERSFAIVHNQYFNSDNSISERSVVAYKQCAGRGLPLQEQRGSSDNAIVRGSPGVG